MSTSKEKQALSSKGLSDYPFKAWVQWIAGKLGFSWDGSIDIVTRRINWNKGVMCVPVTTSSQCFGNEEVGLIVSTYCNLVLSGDLPEYNRDTALGQRVIGQIEQGVSDASGRPLERVKLVLWEMWYAYKDGSLPTDEIIRPITATNYASARETPPFVSSSSSIGELFDNVATTLKWAFILGGSALAAYYAYQLYQSLSSSK